MAWQIMVRFKSGHTSVYSSDYCAGQPEDLIARLNQDAQEITDQELAEIGATRDGLTVSGWRHTNSWQTVAGFIDRYRMPGSPTGAQVVERMQGMRR